MSYDTDESMDNTPIKHLIIGDYSTKKIIMEFSSSNDQPKTKKEIIQIFNKLCKTINRNFRERNKITSKNENYFFIILDPDYIYILLAKNGYPERYIFELFDKINSDIINKMVNDETRELNSNGKQEIEQLIDVYQDPKELHKLEQIYIDDNACTYRININKNVENVNDVNELSNKSEEPKLESKECIPSSDEISKINSIKFEKESNKNKKYSVEFKGINEHIKIQITSIGEIPSVSYENKFSLSDVKKYLPICNNMSEFFILLEPQLKKINELKLIEEDEKINLIILLPSPLAKSVSLSIPQIKKDTNSEIKELYKIINQQQKLINKLNERLTILEREREEEAQFYICKNSKIIPNDREKDLSIRKWIDSNKKDFKIKLLYRKSRDGSQSNVYHNLCDNKNNLLTIIETDHNLKFGGFVSKSWGIPNQYNEKTFMFSLNSMKKFERLNNDNSKHDGSSYGPVFGNGWDIFISSSMDSGREQICSSNTFFKKYEITHYGKFNVKEIEVYQIE